MKVLILGGARSGKSGFAEQRAQATGKKLFYIATGWPGDDEMQARIEHHQQGRGNQWQLLEEPVAIGLALRQISSADHAVVVDCLTLWLSNCVERNCFTQEKMQLFEAVTAFLGDVYLVSNEVGSGVVPLGPLSREFVDESGRLHQQLAQLCDRVHLVVAGLPLALK